MSRKFRRKNKFDSNGQSINTILSLICAIVNFVLLIVIGYKATVTDGNVSLMLALVGVLAIVIGIYGIYYAIKGLKVDDNNYLTIPLVAIISNGIITLILVVMYIVGIFLSV